MFKMRETVGAVLAITIAAFTAFAQAPPAESPHRSITKTEAVEYLYPEQVTVTAGKGQPCHASLPHPAGPAHQLAHAKRQLPYSHRVFDS